MARTQTANRAERLMECATDVFMERGYRRTQIADIARAMGVAPGTIYLYVVSKEALFDLVLQRALEGKAFVFPADHPVPTPPPGALLARITQQIVAPDAIPTLTAALQRGEVDRVSGVGCRVSEHAALTAALQRGEVEDARAELSIVITELYTWLYERRLALKLLDRSTLDWPELIDLFYHQSRRGLIRRLTDYLTLRIAQKRFRPIPDAATAARLILETAAWFTLHRHGDRDSGMIDEEMAQQTVVTVLTNAFISETHLTQPNVR